MKVKAGQGRECPRGGRVEPRPLLGTVEAENRYWSENWG